MTAESYQPGDHLAHLVIRGRPVVAKNRNRIVRYGQRVGIRKSREAEAWMKGAVPQLRAQWGGRPPLPRELPVNAAIVTYLAARQRPDASNLYEGPQDALEAAGIIENDYQIVSHDGSRRLRDRDDPRVEITLTAAQ